MRLQHIHKSCRIVKQSHNCTVKNRCCIGLVRLFSIGIQLAYVTVTVTHIKTFVDSAAKIFSVNGINERHFNFFLCCSWFAVWVGLETILGSCILLIVDMVNVCHTEAFLMYFLIQTLASTVFLPALSSRGSSFECQFRNCVWFSSVFPGLC